MRTFSSLVKLPVIAVAIASASLVAGCSTMSKVSLTGAQENPPVSTSASGNGTIKVASDKSVSGMISVSGTVGTVAHIHEGAPGVNGPVIVPLTKSGDSNFTVPANAKLTDAQYASFMAGNLYVNVHSASHPNGEIRAQLPVK